MSPLYEALCDLAKARDERNAAARPVKVCPMNGTACADASEESRCGGCASVYLTRPAAAQVSECFPLLDPAVPEGGSRFPEKGCYRVGCPIHGGPGGLRVVDEPQPGMWVADLEFRITAVVLAAMNHGEAVAGTGDTAPTKAVLDAARQSLRQHALGARGVSRPDHQTFCDKPPTT